MNLLSRETRARLLLRAVVLVSPVLALLAARPVDQPHGWFFGLTVVLSVGFAAMPESAARHGLPRRWSCSGGRWPCPTAYR